MRKEFEETLIEIFDSLREIEMILQRRLEVAKRGFNATKQILNLVDFVMKMVRISVATGDAAADGVATAYRLAGTASRGLAIAGVVFSAVLLPVDAIYFGISVKALAKKEKCELATQIRKWLEEELPADETIHTALDILKNATIEHGRSAKLGAKADDGVFEKSKKNLEEALNTVNKLINKD